MELSTLQWVLLTAGAIYLLICGISGLVVATEKNRSEGEGFVYGLLFGPIGVLIEACLATRPSRPVDPGPSAGERPASMFRAASPPPEKRPTPPAHPLTRSRLRAGPAGR